MPKPHTEEVESSMVHTEAGGKTDRLPTQGPLMAQSQALTGRQTPGRAAGCSDLHWNMGFHPGKGGLCGGERRWVGQPGAQEPQLRVTDTLLPSPRQQLHGAGGVSAGAGSPSIYGSHGSPPWPQLLGCSCPCQL